MSDALTLPAETRDRAGKGASRALRREGRVPAVIYGGKEEPTPIHVEAKELARQLGTGHFMNSIVMIDVGGKSVRAIPKDVAMHPVTDRPVHVDFLRLSKDAKIQVAVPVVFANEEASPGLKKGGVLNVAPSAMKSDAGEGEEGEAEAATEATEATEQEAETPEGESDEAAEG